MKRLYSQTDPASEPVVYIDTEQTAQGANAVDCEGKELQRGLRKWTFDVKTRKRYYISATGKAYSGSEASKHFVMESGEMQAGSRNELLYLMKVFDTRLRTNDLRNLDALSSWGIPDSVVAKYKQRGVEKLFPWQRTALLGAIKAASSEEQCHHVIYSAPTSGGKTLVSEILMLRKLAMRRGTIFFVVPFVALADQKTTYFRDVWGDLKVGVMSFHAAEALSVLTYDVDVAVCTIEKANILFNQLVEEGRQAQLSMVVIDELHMLEDSNRGFLLEVLLAKVKFLMEDRVQIVGMSATLPNLHEVSAWLGGSHFSSSYRPVNLDVRLCSEEVAAATRPCRASNAAKAPGRTNNGIWQSPAASYSISKPSAEGIDAVRNMPPEGGSRLSLDTFDRVFVHERRFQVDSRNHGGATGWLALEAIAKGQNTIIFCATKNDTEDLSSRVAEGVAAMERDEQKKSKPTVASLVDDSIGSSSDNIGGRRINPVSQLQRRRYMLLNRLRHTQGGLSDTLARTVKVGVAYHHAGLMADQRKLVEEGFSEGVLNLIVATTTLAAGVNLPAHRVIIKGVKSGLDYISVSTFRQMAGRAGRMGMTGGAKGEAILVVGNLQKDLTERGRVIELVTGDVDHLKSHLHQGRGGGLEKLLLDVIAFSGNNKNVRQLDSEDGVEAFIACTLLKRQYAEAEVEEWTRGALQFLLNKRFVLRVSAQSLLLGTERGLQTQEVLVSDKNGYRGFMADVQANEKKSMNHSGGGEDQELQLKSRFSLQPSPLGKATVTSGLAPQDAIGNIKYLQQACERLVLRGGVQPLFLITPPNARIAVNWKEYLNIFDVLCEQNPEIEAPALHLGVCRARLADYQYNQPKENSEHTKFDRRFYATIVLLSLVNERPVDVVEGMMRVKLNDLYNLQSDASQFCYTTTKFCRALNWDLLASVLESYADRLTFGVRDNLLPLVRACGPDIMHSRRAQHFFKAGIKNAQDIVSCHAQSLSDLITREVPFVSKQPLVHTSSTNSAAADIDEALDAQAACAHLTHVIQRKAAAYLAEDAELARFLAANLG